MIIVPCKQGDARWRAERIGIPTASCFDQLLTPKTRKPSTQSTKYLYRLAAEWLLGMPLEGGSTAFMGRGTALEDRGIAEYAFDREVEIQRIGFIKRDDGMVGGSPDGLIVGQRKGVEMKVLSIERHIEALDRDGPDEAEHKCQIQGYMWLCDCDEWDRVYFHPELPSVVWTFARDQSFIDQLEEELDSFVARLLKLREKLIAKGCVPKPPVMDEIPAYEPPKPLSAYVEPPSDGLISEFDAAMEHFAPPDFSKCGSAFDPNVPDQIPF